MITLLTPPEVNVCLGDDTKLAAYEKFVLAPITYDPVTQTINATVRMSSTSKPEQKILLGSMHVSVSSGMIIVEVPELRFHNQLVLTAGQKQALVTQITNAQNSTETGLLQIGLVAGTQSAGP